MKKDTAGLLSIGCAILFFSTPSSALTDQENERMMMWAYATICKVSLSPSQERIAKDTFDSVANRVRKNPKSKVKSASDMKRFYLEETNDLVLKAGGCSQMYSSRSLDSIFGQ